MKNISMIERKDCLGCTACMNICPNSAIDMRIDQDGFLYPNVNALHCDKDCEECFKVCPIFNRPVRKDEPKAYVVMADTEIRRKTSSGGAFDVLARYVLERGGIVVGAIWTKDWKVNHAVISSENELYKLHDIKYVESNLGTVYKEVKKNLKDGFLVLFSGFLCHIKGLINYLGEGYGNLLTYEVFCHGIPSSKALEKYMRDHIGASTIKEIYFRNKELLGWNTANAVYYNEDSLFLQKHNESEWWYMYQHNLAFRESCYECNMLDFPRYSDFSSCDYWEVHRRFPDISDNLGASLLFVNSNIGEKIFSQVVETFHKVMELPKIEAKQRTNAVYKKLERPYGRKEFYKDMNKSSLLKAIRDAEMEHYDVGIIGYWYALNYGSALTYYSLFDVLSKLGLKPVIIECTFDKTAMEHKNTISREFIKKYAKISPYYPLMESYRINKLCDSFVVGSDQVWTADAIRLLGHYFFLDFVSDDKKKVAYAPSWGREEFVSDIETIKKTQYFLKQFNSISVRESSGVKLCKDIFNVDAVRVLDPVFLMDIKEYEKIASNSNKTEKNFIFAYVLDYNNEKNEIIDKISKTLNAKVIKVTDARRVIYAKDDIPKDYNVSVTVEDWVYYFKNAKYVFTDSHHGLAMAIIFKKQFLCFMNQGRGATRFISLMRLLKIESRLVYHSSNVGQKEILENINYNEIDCILEEEKENSMQWLKGALL